MPALTDAVMEQLRARPFNGNVRELENTLHRAVALGEGSELSFRRTAWKSTSPFRKTCRITWTGRSAAS
jgi:DNA-binding NtrC family response regulator